MFLRLQELIQNYPALMAATATVFVASSALLQSTIRVYSLKRITLPAAFFFTYLVMIYFPSVLVYADRPGPYRDDFIVSVLSILLTVPLGILFTNILLKFDYAETIEYFSAKPKLLESFRGMYIVHVLLALLLSFLLLHYFINVPVVPLFEIFRHPGDAMGLTMAREEAFKLLDPRWGTRNGTLFFYAYLFMRTVIFPLVILTSIGYALITRKTKWILLAAFLFLTGGFYATSSLARAPISAIFMRLFFFLFLFYGGRVGKKTMIVFGVLMLTFPILVTTFGYSDKYTLLDGILAVGKRLTYAPALDLYYYFEIFPGAKDYLYGGTLLKPLLKFAGMPFFYIENFVALYISPFGVKSAHANAAFLSNLNADFGLAGVLTGGFFMGAMMQAIHVYLARGTKTILNIAVYSFMVYAIWVLNFASVTSVLLVNGVLPVLLLVGTMRWAAVLVTRIGDKSYGTVS